MTKRPQPGRPGAMLLQTYEQYLETMDAYNFAPMDRELWQDWQVHYHGRYKPSRPGTLTREDLWPHIIATLDDAGCAHPIPYTTTREGKRCTLVAWQAGFEPVVVAVKSYLPGCTVGADEAEEIAADYLTEKDWFAGPPTEAAYVLLPDNQ